MIVRVMLLVAIALLWSELPATSRGAGVRDEPWNPHHLDNLPSEIRQYISKICRGPARAQHDFATFSPRESRWRINLEYLQCDGLFEFRRDHKCLDVDFVSVNSRFRLARKHYADCGY